MGRAFALALYALYILNSPAYAADVTPAELYERCYYRMVKKIVPVNDALMAKVKTGVLTAPAACMQLFDKALFNASSGSVATPSDPVAKAVVKSFHDLNRSFFQVRINLDGSGATNLVTDTEEPALYITRALFQSGVPYSSIVTETHSLRGVRVRDQQATVKPFEAQRLFANYGTAIPALTGLTDLRVAYRDNDAAGAPTKAMNVATARVISTGELVGVQANADFTTPGAFWSPPRNSPADVVALITEARRTLNITKNYGGGILGSTTYISQNANLTFQVLPEGEDNINRRLSSRAYTDLLCHELPTLLPTDVQSQVIATSPFAFRKSASCMTCHSQMDPLAYSYRNLVRLSSSAALSTTTDNQVGLQLFGIGQFPGNGSESGPWYNRKPAGLVYYRELKTGTVRRTAVNDIAGAGAAFAASNDLYTCAAKRYYKFLTGVDVPLRALSAPTDTASSTYAKRLAKYQLDMRHQNAVFSLGASLKSHQSLRTLISQIVNSATFKSRDYSSTTEVP